MKCHGISEKQVEDSSFVFICSSCRRKEEEANQPKLPPLKLRLTSASPGSGGDQQSNSSASPSLARRLESVQIPIPRPSEQTHQPSKEHTQPWVDGPSLSPRGQALGPPGIRNSEAAYGSPTKGANGSSSPMRPYSSGMPSRLYSKSPNLPASSPPPFNLQNIPSSPNKSAHMSPPRQNGSSFGIPNPFGPSQPHTQSFGRPVSAAGPAGSPVKHSPAASPRPTNGLPTMYNFNSPHSSFPPSSAHRPRPSFSPTKHSSPAPLPAQMSSPAPAPIRIAPSPSSQMPAQMLPDPIPAPSKHDAMRPVSSHQMSETPVFPPVKSLDPVSCPPILEPPTKKQSPQPDRFFPPENTGQNGMMMDTSQ